MCVDVEATKGNKRAVSRSLGGIKSKRSLLQCKQVAGNLCMQRGKEKVSVNRKHALQGKNLLIWGLLISSVLNSLYDFGRWVENILLRAVTKHLFVFILILRRGFTLSYLNA